MSTKEEKVMLTKEEILKVSDLQTREINIPEWGGSIVMKTMTGEERDTWENRIPIRSSDKKVDIKEMKVRLLILCIRDPKDMTFMFTEKDVVSLNSKNSSVIDRLWQVASEMNGIGGKELEEIRKNS